MSKLRVTTRGRAWALLVVASIAMFQLQFAMAPTASADNACNGAFQGTPVGTLALDGNPDGAIPPASPMPIAVGTAITLTATWDPADWSSLDRYANCLETASGVSTISSARPPELQNTGTFVDTSFTVPTTLQPGDTFCIRARLSGNPTGGNSTQKSGILCWKIGDTPPPPPPDVKISKAASDTTVVAGDEVIFTLTVENTGDSAANDVVVQDVIDADLQILGTTDCNNASPVSGQTVTCQLGTVNAHASKSFTIRVKALAGACPSVDNQATVSASNEPSANQNNNTSNRVTINVSCPNPDVVVSKSASTSSVNPGGSVTFTITASNSGQATATNVQIQDVIPSGMTISGTSNTHGNCSVSGQTVTCGVGDINAGASKSISITVTATAGACPSVNNRATVSASNEPGSATGNNTSNTVTINVNCPDPDVQIAKSSGAPATGVAPGDEFTYTIRVTNAGGANATGVTIRDSIPADLVIVSYPTNCSVSGNDLTCDLGDVAAGASESVTLTVRATEAACPMVTNRATVTATNEPSGNQGNNTSNDVTTLVNCEPPPPPDEDIAVRIVKTNDADRDGDYSDNEEARRPDTDVPFLLVITNTGRDPWTITDLTDRFDGQTVNLLRDKCADLKGITLQPGESATCNFTLNAYSPPAGDPKDNTAEVCVESMTGGKTDCDDDDSRVRSRDVLGRTITPTKTPPGGTAYTGSEGSLGFGAIALSLLLLGSGLVWAGYRRRQQYDG